MLIWHPLPITNQNFEMQCGIICFLGVYYGCPWREHQNQFRMQHSTMIGHLRRHKNHTETVSQFLFCWLSVHVFHKLASNDGLKPNNFHCCSCNMILSTRLFGMRWSGELSLSHFETQCCLILLSNIIKCF